MVLALNVMHHMDDLDRAATELARVVRPGGRILLVDEDFGDPDHSFGRVCAEHHHGPELIDADAMAGRLGSVGLEDATPPEGRPERRARAHHHRDPICALIRSVPAEATPIDRRAQGYSVRGSR
ncbi:MAG: methyltransferase domain-containing protein [Acidimicrobiia bacterium]|nr:methyltransferase domain-containing protein [Acidimicrobiia bacterium]